MGQFVKNDEVYSTLRVALVQKYGNIVDHWEPAVGKVDSEGVASSGGRMNVEYLPVGVTGAH